MSPLRGFVVFEGHFSYKHITPPGLFSRHFYLRRSYALKTAEQWYAYRKFAPLEFQNPGGVTCKHLRFMLMRLAGIHPVKK